MPDDVCCRTCGAHPCDPCECAERDLDRRIREECEARGLRFKPWEPRPWDSDVTIHGDPPEYQRDAETWRLAQRLRQQLVAELEATGDE